MKKLQFVMKNKIMIAVMVVVMAFGMSAVPVDAAAVTTDVVSTFSGYTLYVRESGSTTLLGTMYVQKKSASISNTFTAAKRCGATSVYVSSTNSNFKSKSVTDLAADASVIVDKSVKASYAYGYCTVSYTK